MPEQNVSSAPALPLLADLWALSSLRPLASSACHHSAALHGVLLREACPLVNILPRELLRSVPHSVAHEAAWAGRPRWDALLLTAAPKAGSTLLRRKIVPALAPDYRNVYGRQTGEENDAQTCAEQRAALVAAARPSNASFFGLVVREPLSRFIAGMAEVMRSHCGDWLRWREKHGRSDPAGFHLLTPGRPCRVKSLEGEFLEWYESARAWPLLKRLFMKVCARPSRTATGHPHRPSHNLDLAHGYRNKHIDPQAIYALNTPAPLDAVLHLEVADHWRLLLTAARLPAALLDHASLADDRANRNSRRENLSSELDPTSVDIFYS
eukprot:3114152-Prymnesium_polylepis.1